MTATAFRQPEAGWQRPPLDGVAGQLATDVIDTVKHAARRAPRSLQAAVGPSELGTPCTRRLAYKVLDWPARPNQDSDPWASVIGTSVHAWMAAAFLEENRQLGEERYLIERHVMLPGNIPGSCDLYDRATQTVTDWKITGLDRLKTYRRDGPGQQYRWQAHCYGLGLQLAGEQPRHVAICFLPRGGRVDGLHVWSEPYDPAIAVQAIRRYQATRQALWTLDPEKHPDRWAMFPTADAYCSYCPFHLPMSSDLGKGCPGHKAATSTTSKE